MAASLIICDNAINHKTPERNPNSFDLSKANFDGTMSLPIQKLPI